jgi:hypothetical protein
MSKKQPILDLNSDKLKGILERIEKKLPPKPQEGLTLKQVIFKSRPMINRALKRGYSYDEVAAILTEEGIPVKGATLRQYLTESKPKKSKGVSKQLVILEAEIPPAERPAIATKGSSVASKSKAKSVVKGSFSDIPSNEEL